MAESDGHVLVVTGLGQPGQRENGQRTRRVLHTEVAVGNVAARDRVPVPLVDGRVEDLLVLVEADVQQRPGAREQRDGDERRRDDPRIRITTHQQLRTAPTLRRN